MAVDESTKKPTAFRLDDEDRAIIEELKKLTGVASAAEIVRMGLRVLVARERREHQLARLERQRDRVAKRTKGAA
jgi:Arc/MetJ-type ribon-helix-helix transcriptional regulator